MTCWLGSTLRGRLIARMGEAITRVAPERAALKSFHLRRLRKPH